jgi:carbon-monoxide dehydrogenase medium subunit
MLPSARQAIAAQREKRNRWEDDPVIPGKFDYHRPATLPEAVKLLAEYGDEARPLAGGHSLIPMMKLRLAQPAHLVDIGRIKDLRGIREDGGEIVIGAMTTQHELLASALLAKACPILLEAGQLIADPQVRYCGTLGGNVANGDPGNDMPAVMQALGASYVLAAAGGSRRVAARDYYEGPYATAAQTGELLTEIRIPRPAAGHGYAYLKLKRKIGDYATAAAAVILTLSGGKCASASIALTNVGDTPIFAGPAAQALIGTTLDAAAVRHAVDIAKGMTRPAADARGPVEYRVYAAGVMLTRAIDRAKSRAQSA